MEDGIQLKIPSSNPAKFSFAKVYEDLCPQYLSMGMTLHEYWDDDAVLVRYFRKTYEINERRKNHDMWLQGHYIHQAMVSALSSLFAKNKSDIYPYPSEPYAITQEEMEERERRRYEAQKERMIASFMGKAKIHEGGQTDE